VAAARAAAGGAEMARVRNLLLLALAFGLLAPVAACGGGGGGGGGGERGPARPARATGPAAAVVEEAEEEEEPGKRYSYNSIGKRDPFRSFIAKEVVVEGGGPLGPLQLHETDAYTLRGIVWNIAAPRAMVEDPEGMGHVVDLGTLIGKNWGKVTQIKPEEIIITEEYRDPIENELIINEITMRLPEALETK